MNWLRKQAARLNMASTHIMPTLFALSALLLLFAAADLVFRHLLGLPKEVAAYLSVLSVIVLLAVWLQRWPTKARSAEATTEEEEN